MKKQIKEGDSVEIKGTEEKKRNRNSREEIKERNSIVEKKEGREQKEGNKEESISLLRREWK